MHKGKGKGKGKSGTAWRDKTDEEKCQTQYGNEARVASAASNETDDEVLCEEEKGAFLDEWVPT